MSITKQIAIRLKAARKAGGFKSARSFALYHKIPETTYIQYEAGSRALNVELILKFSDLLGIKCLWLITGKGEPLSNEDTKDDNKNLLAINDNKKTTIELNKKRICLIDIDLFAKIFRLLIDIFQENIIELDGSSILGFAIDVYNDLIPITATDKEKENLIKISLLSIKKSHQK